MKRYSFILLVVLIAACNSNSSTEKKADGKSEDSPSNKKSATVSSETGGCENLILFHKGAIIEGKSYDATGKEQGGQVTTITAVKNEGAETVAAATLDMRSVFNGKEHTHTMNVNYKCNGKELYMDLGELLSNFSMLKDAKVETSSLEFPLHLSVGQTLPEASVKVQMARGNMNMKTTSLYTNRKVEAMEKVTTPAGTWNCFKIVSTLKTSVDMGGGAAQQKIADMMNQKAPLVKIIMWFAPDFGLVKTETYTGDKLSNHSEIISVKN